MHHSEFLKSLLSSQPDWYLTDWLSSVRIAFGGRGLATFCAAFAILLAPTLFLLIDSAYSHRPALLILAALSLWGFGTSSTSPSGIGVFASLVVAFIGLVCAIMLEDWRLGFAALLPGLTWFGSCAILGTTSSYLIDALRMSESKFQTLFNRGILKRRAADVVGQSIEPAENSNSDSNRE